VTREKLRLRVSSAHTQKDNSLRCVREAGRSTQASFSPQGKTLCDVFISTQCPNVAVSRAFAKTPALHVLIVREH